MKWKCPLTTRFGKDIASLIYRWVWQSKINDVNRTYADSMLQSEYGGVFISYNKFKKYFLFNFRRMDRSSIKTRVWIYNQKVPYEPVADLPKHYWKIKELY